MWLYKVLFCSCDENIMTKARKGLFALKVLEWLRAHHDGEAEQQVAGVEEESSPTSVTTNWSRKKEVELEEVFPSKPALGSSSKPVPSTPPQTAPSTEDSIQMPKTGGDISHPNHHGGFHTVCLVSLPVSLRSSTAPLQRSNWAFRHLLLVTGSTEDCGPPKIHLFLNCRYYLCVYSQKAEWWNHDNFALSRGWFMCYISNYFC